MIQITNLQDKIILFLELSRMNFNKVQSLVFY